MQQLNSFFRHSGHLATRRSRPRRPDWYLDGAVDVSDVADANGVAEMLVMSTIILTRLVT
jgi:hypothetical protein